MGDYEWQWVGPGSGLTKPEPDLITKIKSSTRLKI